MDIADIEGKTRTIGEGQGYLGLSLRDELIHCSVGGADTPAMVSAWKPTQDELDALNQGAAIQVRLVGGSHPPIMVGVGPAPE